jgi:DNA (cytosine-5)-methyltransferase 1
MKICFYGRESIENQLAVITHYLHNRKKPEESVYKESAIREIKVVVETFYPDMVFSSNIAEEALQYGLFSDSLNIPFPATLKPKFTFIDLFAGMGGFRIAMQKQGGRCVFSSEWNKYAQKTYFANFGEYPFGDITKNETKKFIPNNFDLLCAGFPCQPFSIAGVSKKRAWDGKQAFWMKRKVHYFLM